MATYYIKNSGNDSLDGLSNANAWQTITKVNAVWAAGTFAPGDNIYFNKGDLFYGTIAVRESGTVGNSITIGDYGTGVNPVITGFTTISGWTNETNGVYSKVVSAESSASNLVTVDGVNTPMGRWPLTGWRVYTSHSGSVSITDSNLTDAINWSGAQLVLRKSWWTLERDLITAHTGGTITYTAFDAGWGLTDGYGYFIQNDIRTLNTAIQTPNIGDWYYNGSTLYMYFGANDPSTYTVQITTLNSLLSSGVSGTSHFDYITVENINFKGSVLQTIELTSNTHHWVIQNCNFDFAGKNCIDGWQLTHDNTVTNNIINHSNNSAIRFIYQGYNNTITYNTISNTGVLMGMTYSDDEGGDAIVCKDDGSGNSTYDTISYNTINNTGHSGIKVRYKNFNVKYNYINNFAVTKNDAGGLYAWGVENATFESNIILNGYGESGGCGDEPPFTPPTPTYVCVNGIYIDDISRYIYILNNTTAFNRDGGILVQMAEDTTVTGNTVYGNKFYQISIVQKTSTDVYPIRNLVMNNNKFIARQIGRTLYPYMELCLSTSTYENDVNLFGTFNNNYYARPIDQDDVFRTYSSAEPWNGTGRTLAQWKTYSGQDAASLGTPVSISTTNDLHFIYNDTLINKNYTLSAPMKDVANTDYSGVITLLPFTSLVLIGSGTVVEEETTGELTLTEGTWLANRTTLNAMFQNLYNRTGH